MVYFENALLILNDEFENQVDLSACLNNIAVIFRELGHFDKAILFFEKALSIDLALNDKEGIVIDLNNLGSTYLRKSKNYKDYVDLSVSLDFYLRSLELVQDRKDRVLLINTLNNIGIVYEALGKHSLSLLYFQSAIKEAKQTGYDYEMCNINSNIGFVMLHLNPSLTRIGTFQIHIKP